MCVAFAGHLEGNGLLVVSLREYHCLTYMQSMHERLTSKLSPTPERSLGGPHRARWVIILRLFTMVKRYSLIFCNRKMRVNSQVNFVPFHEDCRAVLQSTMAEQVWISLHI